MKRRISRMAVWSVLVTVSCMSQLMAQSLNMSMLTKKKNSIFDFRCVSTNLAMFNEFSGSYGYPEYMSLVVSTDDSVSVNYTNLKKQKETLDFVNLYKKSDVFSKESWTGGRECIFWVDSSSFIYMELNYAHSYGGDTRFPSGQGYQAKEVKDTVLWAYYSNNKETYKAQKKQGFVPLSQAQLKEKYLSYIRAKDEAIKIERELNEKNNLIARKKKIKDDFLLSEDLLRKDATLEAKLKAFHASSKDYKYVRTIIYSTNYTIIKNNLGIPLRKVKAIGEIWKDVKTGECFFKYGSAGYEYEGGGSYSTEVDTWFNYPEAWRSECFDSGTSICEGVSYPIDCIK